MCGCPPQEAPEQARIPDIEERVDAFERLLLVRCMRENQGSPGAHESQWQLPLPLPLPCALPLLLNATVIVCIQVDLKFQKKNWKVCPIGDRTLLSALDYIKRTLGPQYVDSQPLELDAVVDECHCLMPVVFLLSQVPRSSFLGFFPSIYFCLLFHFPSQL